ncbi:glutamine amidotransferase [Thermomonospora echinospora]|uniref:Gamma-glutamyl-hercynylcysteine sulfoxide hydrolase n=1 Tax=Thermomonospora echinospora TaxID=1992 RepID=A0A1H5V1D9_9ACTN|nr:ergothioneine biosynthesis protein EgtC [Thermomonospora echinospora]SEF81046.1 glutamine amidotransferase [Thermomonospora echinospora]
MCRHLGYLGPPRTLESLIFDGPHSLEVQSYAPRMTRGNLLNADGFGVGWFHQERAVRFRRAQPIWTDHSFREIAGAVTASCAVAAIRSATTRFPVEESCAQPFRAGARLFSHNGRVEDFDGVEGKLRELAGDLAAVPDARAPVDSALVFALAARRWREGAPLAEGLAAAVTTVAGLSAGSYNLLAADGTALAATTWGDSLFVRADPGRVLVSSEPLDDDPGWKKVPDRSVVLADRTDVRVTSL